MSSMDIEIAVAEPNQSELEASLSQLRNKGFKYVYGTSSLNEAESSFQHRHHRLFFIEDCWHEDRDSGLNFIKKMYASKVQCDFALLASEPSVDQFYQGALLGISDYLIKSPSLDVGKESLQLINNDKSIYNEHPSLNKPINLGFFRSLGLTQREIEILTEYMKDFPRQQTLSHRVGKSPPQLRKTFSSIYQKTSRTLSIFNSAQLAHLLTIAGLYRSKRTFHVP